MRRVVVSYAGGRQGPYRHEYAESEQLSTVRSDALTHFGIADSAEGGNQVVFRLYHGGDPVSDLSITVGDAEPGNGALAFRLVREVIARTVRPDQPAGSSGVAQLQRHASHAMFVLPVGTDSDGLCIIEPAVTCNHCGYCKSYGH